MFLEVSYSHLRVYLKQHPNLFSLSDKFNYIPFVFDCFLSKFDRYILQNYLFDIKIHLFRFLNLFDYRFVFIGFYFKAGWFIAHASFWNFIINYFIFEFINSCSLQIDFHVLSINVSLILIWPSFNFIWFVFIFKYYSSKSRRFLLDFNDV